MSFPYPFFLYISQKFSMAFFTTFERFQVYQILGIVSILHKRWSDAFLAYVKSLPRFLEVF